MIHQRKLAGAQPELYHLQNDPSEAVDLAAENPEIVAQLSEKVTAWEAELSEPIWGPLKRRK